MNDVLTETRRGGHAGASVSNSMMRGSNKPYVSRAYYEFHKLREQYPKCPVCKDAVWVTGWDAPKHRGRRIEAHCWKHGTVYLPPTRANIWHTNAICESYGRVCSFQTEETVPAAACAETGNRRKFKAQADLDVWVVV